MKLSTLLLLFFSAAAALSFTSCATVSEDPAPGGIKASDTGMNLQNVRDWQDRTIRRLAY
ncbi:MAG TPA: hypothetical protein PLA50_20270 [Bacteroidia bacterium]|nr:hypothetical protein [Bacteroidia bacterium]